MNTEIISRKRISQSRRIVIKVGTSSLSFTTSRLNLQWMNHLACILSAVRHDGIQVLLVSSGAVGAGAGKLGLLNRPDSLEYKQALAAIGQAELIRIYQKFFREHHQQVAQVLLTRDGLEDPVRRRNAYNTLVTLLDMSIIPIINENDTVSVSEMEYGDNDTLSARVAELVNAGLLILLSDIDGLYTGDPKTDPDAHLIPRVSEVSETLAKVAGGAGTDFGTGGMITKLAAAKICREAGIDMVIAAGKNPPVIRDILSGHEVGTYFMSAI